MRAVVVLSGGLDSACAAAMLRGKELYGITFSYGQKGSREVPAARRMAKRLGMAVHKVADIGFMKSLYGSSNALTGGGVGVPGTFDYSIVVPARNAVFLSIAAAWAFSIGAGLVAYGAHSGDRPYPDCRPSFARRFGAALNAAESDGVRDGLRRRIEVWSPYMDGITKEELLRRGARRLGDAVFGTWSCYRGGRLHCGRCESCANRRGAFEAAGIRDRTRYAA